MTPEEIEEMNRELAKQEEEDGNFNRWFWFSLKEKLGNGDLKRMKEIDNEPVIDCFTLLSYWVERDEKIERLKRQQEQQNKNKES